MRRVLMPAAVLAFLLMAAPVHAQTGLSDEAFAALNARYQAALTEMQEGRNAEGAEMMAGVAAEAAAALGESHLETLKARSWRVFALLNAGRYDDAVVEAGAVEALALPTLGRDHAVTDRVSVVLAVGDVRAGRMDPAEQRLFHSWTWNRAEGDTARAAGVGTLLAMVYRQQARDQEADQMLAMAGASTDPIVTDMAALEGATFREDDEAALAISARLLDRPNLGPSLRALVISTRAGALIRAGRGPEAETLLRRTLDEVRRGDDPIMVLRLTDFLAESLLTPPSGEAVDPARAEEGLALWRTSVDDSMTVLGPRHISTVQRRLALGNAFMTLGRREEALAVLEPLLAEDDAEPGVLLAPIRAGVEAGRAVVLIELGRVMDGYRQVRAANATWAGFALASGRREEAGEHLGRAGSLYRYQVQVAWHAQRLADGGT